MDTPRWNRQPFRRPVVPDPPENERRVPPPSFRRHPEEAPREEGGSQRPPREEPPRKRRRRRPRFRFHIPLPRLSPKAAGALLGLIAAAAGIYVLVHQPWFHFGHVRLSGNKYVTLEEVMDAGGLEEPVNIFTIDRSKMEAALKKDVRIQKADIAYSWPNYLTVTVREREPAVYMHCENGNFAKIAYDGCVLSTENAIQDATAPLVTGFSLEDPEPGDFIEDADLKAMFAFLEKLPASIADRISEISLDDRMLITLHLEGGVPFIVGSGENALRRVDTFISLCDDLEQKKIRARYIDMTYEVPYIKVE